MLTGRQFAEIFGGPGNDIVVQLDDDAPGVLAADRDVKLVVQLE